MISVMIGEFSAFVLVFLNVFLNFLHYGLLKSLDFGLMCWSDVIGCCSSHNISLLKTSRVHLCPYRIEKNNLQSKGVLIQLFNFQYDTNIAALSIGQYDTISARIIHTFITHFVVWDVRKGSIK